MPRFCRHKSHISWSLNQQVINGLLSSTESSGHEKILDIAGLQPGSAKSDVRCSPCAPKVIHGLDAVIVVLYRGLGSPFNALKVRPHKKLSPPRHPPVHHRKHVTPLEKIRIASCSLSKSVFSFLLLRMFGPAAKPLRKRQPLRSLRRFAAQLRRASPLPKKEPCLISVSSFIARTPSKKRRSVNLLQRSATKPQSR